MSKFDLMRGYPSAGKVSYDSAGSAGARFGGRTVDVSGLAGTGVSPVGPAMPRIIRFQPLITVVGDGNAGTWETQPFDRWLDAGRVTMMQFQVEIIKILQAKLVLESSLFPEGEPGDWLAIKSWVLAPTPNPEMLVAASDSQDFKQGTDQRLFSRFIRWRVGPADSTDWEICFRIRAMAGAYFRNWPESPRVV